MKKKSNEDYCAKRESFIKEAMEYADTQTKKTKNGTGKLVPDRKCRKWVQAYIWEMDRLAFVHGLQSARFHVDLVRQDCCPYCGSKKGMKSVRVSAQNPPEEVVALT